MVFPGEETEHYRWNSSHPIHLNQQMIQNLRFLPEIENDRRYHSLVWRINRTFSGRSKFRLIHGEESERHRSYSGHPIEVKEQLISRLENDRLHTSDTECQNLFLSHRVSNTPDPKLLLHRSKKPFNRLLFLVFVYGGVLASSWGYAFPSEFEKRLWRIAIVVIPAGSLALLCLLKASVW